MPIDTGTPRPYAARVALAAAFDIVVIGGPVLLRVLLAEQIGDTFWGYLTILLPVGVAAWLAPKVSYRRRDALLWLTGFGGVWLTCIIGWRIASLPYRDWSPRDDEPAGDSPGHPAAAS